MRSRLEQGARGSCLHLTHGVGSTATARIDPDASHLGHIAAHASTMTVTGVTAGMRVSLARPVHRGVDRRLGRTSDHRGRSARASVKPLHPPPHARVDFRRRVATRGAVETAVSEPETSTSSSAAADDAPVEPKPAAPANGLEDGFVVVSAGDGTVLTRPKDPRAKREKVRDERSEAEAWEQLDMEQNFCVLKRRYDPEAIRKEALETPVALARRGAVVVTKFAALFSRKESLMKLDAEDGGTRYATELKNTLTSLGPLFVKLGQNLANRPDLVEEEVMEELTKLQDRVPPFPSAEAFKIMEEDLGRPVAEVFKVITPEPVAAASIGQVYKATLMDGTEVAVKILRPGTRPQVILDLWILRTAAERIFDDWCRENIGCTATLLVDEFAEKLLEELDFVQEANNLRDFKRNFADDPSVHIPGVYGHLSSPRVLVMDWQEGTRCTAEGAFEDDAALRIFLQNGVESGLRQLLDFGLFHGDPHPGNVLALPSGDIAYVDFGNVAEISRNNQENIIDAVVHVMNGDYEGLAECLENLGFLQEGTDVKPIAEGLAQAWSGEMLGEMAATGNFSFRGLTREFNKLLYLYPIRVPERFSLVIRALLTQENICLTLDPNFNFLEAAFPYVARRLLTDPEPNLRMRLLKVVIVKGRFEWERLAELVKMAEIGAQGGVSLPVSTMVELATDGAKMLATDGVMRTMLMDGLRAVSMREHVAQASKMALLVWQLTIGRAWSTSSLGRWLRARRVGLVYRLKLMFATTTSSDIRTRAKIPKNRGVGGSWDESSPVLPGNEDWNGVAAA